MIPLKILMDVELFPIVKRGEKALQPEELGAFSAIGVLVEGTQEGNPVVVVRVDLPNGAFVLGQTTLRLLQTAMLAFTAVHGDLTK